MDDYVDRNGADDAYTRVIALLRQSLAVCDEHGVGLSAAPHIDLALNLLEAEAEGLFRRSDP